MNFHRLLVQSILWRGIYFFTILVLNVVLSRYLQASGAGWVYYLTNWFSLMLLVASFSMESAVTYYAANRKIDDHKLVWLSMLWTLIVSFIIFLIVYIYFGEIRNENELTKNQYLFFALTYIVGILLLNFFMSLFYARKDFVTPNIIMIACNIVLILIILFPGVFGISGENVLNYYFLFFLIVGVFLFFAYSLKHKSWLNLSLPGAVEVKMIFRYAFISLAANIVFFLVYRIDYWFVRNSSVASAVDLGNYIQVSKLGQMLLIIPQIMASVVFPQTASGISRAEVNRNVIVISRLLTQLYVLGFILILATGKFLFPFVFGPTFNKMYEPMLILLPGILSLSILVLLSAYFAGKGNVAVNFRGALIALVFVIVGNYFLVNRYGIYAAATISTIGYTINLLYSLRQFYKDYKINLVDFFAWKKSDYLLLAKLIKSKNRE